MYPQRKNATPTLSAVTAYQMRHFEDCRLKLAVAVHSFCTGNRNTASCETTDTVLTQLIRTGPRIFPPRNNYLSLWILNRPARVLQIELRIFFETVEMQNQVPSETNNTCQIPV